MPPLQPAAHILRVRLAGSIATVSPWNVILHWNYTGPQPPSTTINTLCQQFAAAWLTHLAPVHRPDVSLTTVEAVDLTAPDAAFGSALVSHVGTLVGTSLPASTAVCVSWKVNFRWRGGHPRSYFPAGSANSTTNQRNWTTAAVTQFETAVNGWFGAMNAAASGSVTGRLCCLRRYQTLTAGGPPTEITPPLPLDFVTFDVDSRIDTQRRRLGADVTGQVSQNVYTQQLVSARIEVLTEVELFVTPTTDVVIVRDLLISNMSGLAAVYSLIVASGSIRKRFSGGTVPAGETVHLDVRQRLAPADRLLFSCAALPFAVFITGYVFD